MNQKEKIIRQIEWHVSHFKHSLEQEAKKSVENKPLEEKVHLNWDEIEILLEEAFASIHFDSVKKKDLANIDYIIARQWDHGIILNWFNKGTEEISGVGMTQSQLLILAEHGLNSNEWSSRQQYAASLFKITSNKRKAEKIALRYHKDPVADVRRFAIQSLQRMDYSGLDKLLEESWKLDDEFERLQCLHTWKEMESDKFNDYLEKAKEDPRKYLKNYARGHR